MVQKRAHSDGEKDDVQPVICRSRDCDITPQPHGFYIGSIKILVGQLSSKEVSKVAKLRQNICSIDKNLVIKQQFKIETQTLNADID